MATLALAALAGNGGLAALSKVLALLCPEIIPLMDDAALWFALGAVPCPSTADKPTAGAEWFVPMVDWFVDAIEGARGPLDELATSIPDGPMDAAQVLDRLLWFESWGYRHSHRRQGNRWWWVRRGEREGIVSVAPPHPDLPDSQCADLDSIIDRPGVDSAWRDRARAALDAMLLAP
jgi:hypothetical protein